MKRKLLILCLILNLCMMSLVGCDLEEEEVVEKDTKTDTIQVNELGEPCLSQELSIVDEEFKLICEYDIGDNLLTDWRVTDSKNIGMKVKTKDLPDGYSVSIDHVHADISLKSTSAQINGIIQDSMDDTYHGYSQDGFFIDNNNEYYNIFAIEGYTDKFYELWGSSFGDYGSMSSDYKKLTEKNILKVGTYAEKLTVVYDLSIKTPNNERAYTKSVISNILIPLPELPETDTQTK